MDGESEEESLSSSGHGSDLEEPEPTVDSDVDAKVDEEEEELEESSNDTVEQIVHLEEITVDPAAFEALQTFFKENPCATLAEAKTALGDQEDWNSLIKKYFIVRDPFYIRVFYPPEIEIYPIRKNFANQILNGIESGQMPIENLIFAEVCTFNSHRQVHRSSYRFFGHCLPYYVKARWHRPLVLKVYAAMSFNFLIINFVDDSNDNRGSCLIDTIKVNFTDRQEKLWYIQDGTEFTSSYLQQALLDCFNERILGFDNPQFFGGGITFPPNTPHLSPCDFFLWGYIKNHVYKTKITSLCQLREAVVTAAATITPDMRRAAIRTAIRRLEFMRMTDGETSINVFI